MDKYRWLAEGRCFKFIHITLYIYIQYHIITYYIVGFKVGLEKINGRAGLDVETMLINDDLLAYIGLYPYLFLY